MLALAPILVALLAAAPAAAQDPDQELTTRRTFEQRLAVHPHFSKLAFERIETHPRYLFLVQRSGRDDPARAARLADLYVALLDPLLERFEREVAAPLALVQREDRARFVLVLLASRGDFDNYDNVTQAAAHLAADAFYDRGLNAAVLFEDVFQAAHTPAERARAARHAFVHLCQQAWYAGGQSAPIDTWLLEGMADCWARLEPPAPSARIDPDWLRAFAHDASDEGARWVNLRTFDELVLLQSPSHLSWFFHEKTPADAPKLDQEGSWWAYDRQASLEFQFLWEAAEGRERARLVALLGQLLRAGASAAAAPNAALDAQFLAWVRAAHEAALPNEPLDARFDQALARAADGAPIFSSSPSSPSPAAAPSPPPAPPLDVADATTDERLARALHELSHGSASRAVAALEALEHDTLEAAPRERARRELARAKSWIEVRDAYLAGLIASGKALPFRLGEREYSAKVLAREGEELVLADNRSGAKRLALATLDPLELAQAIKPAGAANDWARFVPYALRGDARLRKLLASDTGEGGALLRDASAEYPATLRLGAAVARVEELAARNAPGTPDEAEKQLAELAALKHDYGDLALVQRKADALHGRARTLLERELTLRGPSHLLHGKLEVLGGERVRLTYPFDDARELLDFDPANYPVLARKGLSPEKSDDVPFTVTEGELAALGQASLRSLVDLAAPLSVRWSLTALEPAKLDGAQLALALGVCDDGREHFVWAINFRELQRYEAESGDAASGEATTFMNTPYALELRHDGTRVALRLEDQEVCSLAAGGRRSGAVFLCAQTDCPVHVAELVIEGQLLPESFARLGRAWVEHELARY